MPIGLSLIFLGVTLAAASLGGRAVLIRIGEEGSSCVLSAVAGAVALGYGVLALLPRPPIPAAAMLPLLAVAAALGVGWSTDTASRRLPHTVANTTLAAVSAAAFAGWLQVSGGGSIAHPGAVIAAAAAPAAAGVLFGPPTTRTVIWWHLLGRAAVAAMPAAAVLRSGMSAAGGLLAVAAVGGAVLAAGRALVWAGQAGAGDPVWVASFAVAAASHAVLSAGRPTPGGEALAVAVMGASVFLMVGGVAALAILAAESAVSRLSSRRSRGSHRAGERRSGSSEDARTGEAPTVQRQRLTLAGQWSALGIAGFAAVWKFTPLGLALAATLPTSG